MKKNVLNAIIILGGLLAVICLAAALVRKNAEISKLEKEVAEKNSSVQNLESAVAGLNDTIKHMQNTFKIITPAKYLPPSDVSPLQKLSKESRELVEKMFESAFPDGISDSKTKNSEAVKKEFAKYIDSKTAAKKLIPVPGSTKKFIDEDATILQALCEKASIPCKTTFFWDSKRHRRWTNVQLPRDEEASSVKIVIGDSSRVKNPLNPVDVIELRETETTVFPITFDLFNSNELKPIGQSIEIPLGGLYVHYFRVFSKGDWKMSYKLPENADPDFINIKVLPLNPACSVDVEIEGNSYIFTVKAPSNEAEFMLFGDNAFIPDSVTASLIKAKEIITGGARISFSLLYISSYSSLIPQIMH